MKRIKEIPYLIEIITALGLILYATQAWYFAHAQISSGDEGAYLYKGYLFAKGIYRPFQDYGFWTNKAPLSFLIPGYIQLWFGAGLRTARYFAIVISVLTLVGVWITARRLGGKAWGALAVWVFALSPFHISISSLAISEGLIAGMLAWVFVCTLGENRPIWQLILGTLLAVIVVMTRQNMIVMPLLLVAYIFWQYGGKAGWWVLITSAILFTGFHVMYWPNILQLWSPWLPRALTPFLDSFRNSSTSGTVILNAGVLSRFQSFATGMRDHFFILCGSLSALILWPKKNSWKSALQFRMAVFLSTLFFSLYGMHTWASLFNNYCVYCYSSYLTFYNIAGLFLILVVFSNGIHDSIFRRIVLLISVLFFAGNQGLFYYQSWGDWLLNHVRLIRVNRILSAGDFTTVSLLDVLTYAFKLPLEIQKRVAAVSAGVLLGVAFILLIGMLYKLNMKYKLTKNHPLIHVVLVCTLFIGTLVPFIERNSVDPYGCSTNFLSDYEQAGRTLAGIVPSKSLVYWKGEHRQLALMLYMDDVRIFPAQIQAGGGFVKAGSDQILKFGRFNEKQNRQWRASADFILISNQNADKEFWNFVDQAGYQALPFDVGRLAHCEPPLLVFRRHS